MLYDFIHKYTFLQLIYTIQDYMIRTVAVNGITDSIDLFTTPYFFRQLY